MANFWIFQANPDTFDIGGFLLSNPSRMVWRAKQLHRQMCLGDVVFIWRSIGKNPPRRDFAGIVAEAEIVQLPAVQDDRLDGRNFWRDTKNADLKEMRVELSKLRRLPTVLKYDRMKVDSTLSSLSILQKAERQRSNYLLESRHSSRIQSLM